MRRVALFLCSVGLVLLVVGTASGCGKLFSFNGRHPVLLLPLTAGTPLRGTFPAKEGKRYTLAVHVAFEREGLAESNGHTLVQAQLPLAAGIEDASGVAVSKVVGFVDPSEAPTVLHGHESPATQRRPMDVGPSELVAERLVGPYTASGDRDVAFTVDLGVDRLGKASIKEARVVIFDDALPRSITYAFVAASAGAAALILGAILLVFVAIRSRRGGARRRQIV